MGNYAHCWLDGLLLGSTKNTIDPGLISFFGANDKVILSPPIELSRPHLQHHRELLSETPDYRIIYYETSIDVVRDRLDILGYDRQNAEDAFDQWKQDALDGTIEQVEEWRAKDDDTSRFLLEHYGNDIDILSSLTSISWINGLREIISRGLEKDYYGRYEECHEHGILGHMLSGGWHGFPGDDVLVALRLAIEALEHGRSMIYDLSDLVGCWLNYEDDFVEYGRNISAEEYGSKAKTVVLTEGSTDAWVLQESLSVLFPHLVGYYSFLDFDASGYGGGVGNLVNTVRALAGAELASNIVAVVDNDTAAASAFKALDRRRLPPNVTIVRLPELKFLERYPTLGPDGMVELDVNGRAASIELYLGMDVLDPDGRGSAPIQWTGYDRALGQYQGEVLEKRELHKRFKRKLAVHSGVPGTDWDPLREVWKVIFAAFRQRNKDIICRRAREWNEA